MLQHFKILTITHRQTKLSRLERYVITGETEESMPHRIGSLKEELQLDELVYLATCNRVLYLFTSTRTLDSSFTESFFRSVQPEQNIQADEVLALEGEKAIHHLLEVAASVDSLVVGERQILGQLREAYRKAHAWGHTADDLRMLMQTAVAAAKSVYARTRIGEKPISVASLAVQKLLAKGLQPNARILLIGAGQTNTLVAKFLEKYNFQQVDVFNRTLASAEKLVARFSGSAYTLDDMAAYRKGFDAIIVCTGAGRPIIDQTLLTSLLGSESTADKLIIDLAIPQNVTSEIINSHPELYIGIDNLRQLAEENMAFRKREVDHARVLLAEKLTSFPRLYSERQLEKALQQLPHQVRAVKERAMNEVFSKEVAELDDDARELMERMLTYMEKKCVGIPMRVARETLVKG